MRGEKVIEAPVDRDLLTQRYTEEAIRFITANRDRPFFLYLPHAMPAARRAPSPARRSAARARNGPYGDSVEELDWSTGEILAALKKLGLDEKTLVVWTSDNGAPQRKPAAGEQPAAGGLGLHDGRGRHARAVHRPLAGQGSGRHDLRASWPPRWTCCRRSRSWPGRSRRKTASSTATTSGRCWPASPAQVAARGVLLLSHGPAAGGAVGQVEAVPAAGEQAHHPRRQDVSKSRGSSTTCTPTRPKTTTSRTNIHRWFSASKGSPTPLARTWATSIGQARASVLWVRSRGQAADHWPNSVAWQSRRFVPRGVTRMAKAERESDDFDNPWKEALQLYLQSFLAFFFAELHDDIDWSAATKCAG